MTRVVVLSGFRIFPAINGAQVHTSGITRALARLGYDVLIYSLAGRGPDYRHANRQPYVSETLEPRLVEETHLGWGFGIVQTIVRRIGQPRYLQYKLLEAGIAPARCKLAIDNADVVISDMSYVPVIPGWRDKPWYMISHNLEHRLLAQDPPKRRMFARWMQRVEAEAPLRFTDLFAVTDEDQAFFKANDVTRQLDVPIVTCAVDPMAYLPDAEARARIRAELGLNDDDRVLAFAGSAYAPNTEALVRIRAFARAHREWLEKERVFFLVLGSVANAPERDGPVIVTGRVPEIAPYFSASDAGLNPITRGAGANVKLFEYIAAKLPVISTSFGVRGSALVASRDYLHFDDDSLLDALRAFVAQGDRAYWQTFAEGVWQRHRTDCDITEVVRSAIARARGFPPP